MLVENKTTQLPKAMKEEVHGRKRRKVRDIIEWRSFQVKKRRKCIVVKYGAHTGPTKIAGNLPTSNNSHKGQQNFQGKFKEWRTKPA